MCLVVDDACFLIFEVDLGILLVWGGILCLVRELGFVVIKELVFTCWLFGVVEVLVLRFLNRVVFDDYLLFVGGVRLYALEEVDVILLLGVCLNWIMHFGLFSRFDLGVRVI